MYCEVINDESKKEYSECPFCNTKIRRNKKHKIKMFATIKL